MTSEFLQSAQLSDLFIDALVTDNNNQLLFLSAWGNESVVQQTRARLSLSDWEQQLRGFRLTDKDMPWASSFISIDRTRTDDVTGRPAGQTVFSHLTQLWLYDKSTLAPDLANRRCVLLRRHGENMVQYQQRIWKAVQAVCSIPLHHSWDKLLTDFTVHGWLTIHTGFNMDACSIYLPDDEIEIFVTEQVQSKALVLPELH